MAPPGDSHPEPKAFGEPTAADHMTALDEDEVNWYGDTLSYVTQGKATHVVYVDDRNLAADTADTLGSIIPEWECFENASGLVGTETRLSFVRL